LAGDAMRAAAGSSTVSNMATIFGRSGPGSQETINGTAQDDVIWPLGGWDFVNGGGGFDVVMVMAPSTAFRVTTVDGVTYIDTISAASASAEQVVLRDVEEIRFTSNGRTETLSLLIDDTYLGQPGTDFFDGGPGTDTVAYARPRADHQVTRESGKWVVRDQIGDGGRDVLTSIERLSFSDAKVALDLGRTEKAGQAALLIGAVLGGTLMREKPELMGAVIGLFDQSFTLPELAGALMRLDGVWPVLTGGSSTPEAIAGYLHEKVNGARPSPAQLAEAVAALTQQPQGAYLAALATSDANVAQVDLTGLAQTGLVFVTGA
jgi:hypothetical protein